MALTKTQYERLVESAVSATHYRGCNYWDLDAQEPQCVIGQFASRYGADVSKFPRKGGPCGVGVVIEEKLWDGAGVDFGLLQFLQTTWDSSLGRLDEDEARLAMLFEIEAARGEP